MKTQFQKMKVAHITIDTCSFDLEAKQEKCLFIKIIVSFDEFIIDILRLINWNLHTAKNAGREYSPMHEGWGVDFYEEGSGF